jgi:hypothetical protein
MALPGLQRPCLESGRAWAAALRRIEDHAVVELGRANGRAKVFREILAYLRGTVSIVDKRAVSSIAKRLGLTPRCVRMHLAALERDGWVLRVHHAGLRFPGQRGWATSAYLVPTALPDIAAMPFSRQAKARADLRHPDIAAALLAAGHAQALRAVMVKSPAATVGSGGVPRGNNRKTSSEMGEAHPFVRACDPPAVSEITIALPLPPRGQAGVDNPGHAGHDAGGAGAPSLSSGSLGGGKDHGWPELGCSAPRTPLAARTRPGTKSGDDGRGHPALAGLTPSAAAAQLEAMGVPRSEAVQRAVGYSRTAAWRRFRRARGEPEGRQPRWRAEARAADLELKRLRDERRIEASLSDDHPS